MNRHTVTWGRPGGMGDHPDELHCFACGVPLPRRATVQCSECAHAWRWGWLLSLADARAFWGLRRGVGPWDFVAPWWHYLHIRRLSKIWVCPCCTHDF